MLKHTQVFQKQKETGIRILANALMVKEKQQVAIFGVMPPDHRLFLHHFGGYFG